MKEKTLAKINNVQIEVVESEDQNYVPVKPICDALGIDFKSQYDKIKNDETLISTVVLSTIVAQDGKHRDMVCIPFKYVFGWLFTISPKNVSESARKSVLQYRNECYDALYDYFSGMQTFLKEKEKAVNDGISSYKQAQYNFKNAKNEMVNAKKTLDHVRQVSYGE